MRFFFFILMAIQASLFFSGCKSSSSDDSSVLHQQISYEKILRFEKYITNTVGISCGITFDKKIFCNNMNRVNQKISLFEQSIPSGWAAKMVNGGRNHVCAIFEGPSFDEVWCRGTGTSGELGDGLSTTSDSFVKVSGLPEKRILDLASENVGTCATTEEKEVYCWGRGYFPSGVSSPSTTAFKTPLTGVLEIKGVYNSYCALKEDRSLWCWGIGTSGNLGQGNLSSSAYTPLRVKDTAGTGFLTNVDDFAVGQQHSCALIAHEVYCWGNSRAVGIDQDPATTLPRHLPELSGAIKIEAGDFHTCALLNTGEFYCWGQNRNLQISGTEDRIVITPRKVDFSSQIGEISSFSLGTGTNPTMGRTCVVNVKGEVYCWGSAANGLFGTLFPFLVKNFTRQNHENVSSVAIANSQVCLIKNGKPYFSGFNDYAQIVNDRYILAAPFLLENQTVSDFSCSRYANCFVSDNKMFCRGLNFTNLQEVTALGSNVLKVVLASHTNCALTNDHKLYCWGTNSNGQVGNGTTTTVAVTAPYLTMSDVESAVGGLNVLCALKSDKTVWCWGNNSVGTVGHDNASETNVLTPAPVQGLPDLTSSKKLSLILHNQAACVHADSDIYCWGLGIGRLLSQSPENAYKAQKISALSGKVEKVAIIYNGVCASYSDFSVSCFAEMGGLPFLENQNTIRKQSYPPIGQIEELVGGSYLLCQRLSNGQLYCLGNNSYGGMNHAGVAPPLVLNPEKWLP